tara:strand:+ start:775 stop:2211 length:1437 start_codon:yes stop_codon:yes gene_type:complete
MKKKILVNKTKIIATIGPSSYKKSVLEDMIISGVDAVRLNFSHGEFDKHKKVIENTRKISDKLNIPIAIIQDLQGPKIRIGKIKNDKIKLNDGQNLDIQLSDVLGTNKIISISNKNLFQDINPDEHILIDDGKIKLKVLKKTSELISTIVESGGELKSNKGVNLPDTDILLSSLTEKDKKDLDFGLENGVDWIALSFVRSSKDVNELRKIINSKKLKTKIIAKIEKPQALKNIDKIIESSDALMVARGDLGVEIPMESVPIYQKRIVNKCNKQFKPVIIATQMLESMIDSKTPTRAEANDVANAVLDGADAVMLSAESATGKYPVLTVKNMDKIINSIEKNSDIIYNKFFEKNKSLSSRENDSLIRSACRLSRLINSKAIVTMTKSGYTGLRVSGHRPKANILIVTNDKNLLNVMSFIWGIRGIIYDKNDYIDNTIENIESILIENKFLKKKDKYIITASMPSHWKGHTNMMKVSRVE